MVSNRSILIGVFIILVVCTHSALICSQGYQDTDKTVLATLIDSPRTKQILTEKDGFPPSVVFDMATLALDRFRSKIVVATVDFEHTPSGLQGTASIAYKKTPTEWQMISSSYWLWGTVVSGDISINTTWTEAGSPYYVTDNVTVLDGITLTIEPNSVVRVRKYDTKKIEIFVEGTLNCQGSTFTTSCDFENYDMSQMSWDDADWKGFQFWATSSGDIQDSLIEYAYYGAAVFSENSVAISNSTIKRCVVGANLDKYVLPGIHTIEDNLIEDCVDGVGCLYLTSSTRISGNTIMMGPKWSGSNGIFCFDSPVVITSNNISNYNNGIEVTYCAPDINSNTIQNNTRGIFCYAAANPSVNNNNIEGNLSYGLYNDDMNFTIYAVNNWWGDASGPYHATLNPGGLGDEVSDYVNFTPWLTSAVTIALVSLVGWK